LPRTYRLTVAGRRALARYAAEMKTVLKAITP
jgi:hypothetical protein